MIPKETQENLDQLTPEQHMQLELAFRKYGNLFKLCTFDLVPRFPRRQRYRNLG